MKTVHESGKKVRKVSAILGDRIKIDVLLFLKQPCVLYPEDEFLCGGGPHKRNFKANYSTISTYVKASSSVLPRKIRELKEDGLIAIEELKVNNEKMMYLTSLGNKVAENLIEIDDLLTNPPDEDEEGEETDEA